MAAALAGHALYRSHHGTGRHKASIACTNATRTALAEPRSPAQSWCFTRSGEPPRSAYSPCGTVLVDTHERNAVDRQPLLHLSVTEACCEWRRNRRPRARACWQCHLHHSLLLTLPAARASKNPRQTRCQRVNAPNSSQLVLRRRRRAMGRRVVVRLPPPVAAGTLRVTCWLHL